MKKNCGEILLLSRIKRKGFVISPPRRVLWEKADPGLNSQV
jgi:hypothetical protein